MYTPVSSLYLLAGSPLGLNESETVISRRGNSCLFCRRLPIPVKSHANSFVFVSAGVIYTCLMEMEWNGVAGLLRGDEVELLGRVFDGPSHAGRRSQRHIPVSEPSKQYGYV